MALQAVARMAANPNVLKSIGRFLKGDQPLKQFLMYRIAPDAAFATLNAAQTPGGLDDKLIAGITDFGLSAGTGLVTGGAARRMGADPGIENLVDMMGSYGGAMASYPAGMAITRGLDKLTGGPGLTDFEKMREKEQQAYVDQIRRETLEYAGLIPGINPTYYNSDYLAQLGLA